MPTVTANVSTEEKRQLGTLGFITKLSGRVLAGQGVQMILQKNSKAIRRYDKLSEAPEKKNGRRKKS